LASTTIQPKAHAAVPPAVSQIFYAQTPMWASLLAFLLLRESFSPSSQLGIAAFTLSLAVAAAPDDALAKLLPSKQEAAESPRPENLSATALIAPRAATPALTRVRVETLNFGEMLQNVAKQVGGARASAAASQTAGEKLKALLGKAEGVDPAEIAAACADDVLYEDMASSTFKGPAAVAAYFTTKYQGCRIA
ncbi:hypothetical protein AURANDRAFT_69370, partial [Aureococcus anophagefferens]